MTEILETGAEPEFTAMRIAKTDSAGFGMVRIYWACERGQYLQVVFTQIVPAVALPHLAQALVFDPPRPSAETQWEARPN